MCHDKDASKLVEPVLARPKDPETTCSKQLGVRAILLFYQALLLHSIYAFSPYFLMALCNASRGNNAQRNRVGPRSSFTKLSIVCLSKVIISSRDNPITLLTNIEAAAQLITHPAA